MNPERLLQHFDAIGEADDAVPKFRRFILDLAMRGKLVEQNPDDEPASTLLKKIQEEKVRIEGLGVLRNQTSQPLDEKQIPFDIPVAWRWSQLAEVGVINPRIEAKDSVKASFVPMPMIFAEYGRENQHEVRLWGAIKKGFTQFAEGDVGLAKITPCFENGKSAVLRNLAGGIGAGTTELHIVRPILVLADYILIFLKSPHFIETGIPKMTGSAGQKRVPKDYFAFSAFPLPSLAEQHRIVAMVDELMVMCDELEAARSKRETDRDRLVSATLHRLNNGEASPEAVSGSDFKETTRFYFNHLSRLTARPEHIKQFRQTILSLAVHGKLVPQGTNSQTASSLLRQMEEEKQKLVRDGIAKQNGPLPPVKPEEDPYQLPQGWEWVRLGSLTSKIGSGSTPRGGKSVYTKNGVISLRSQNVWNDGLKLNDVAFIPDKTHRKMSNTHVFGSDILLNITGASLGRCALVPDDLGAANVSQHVTIIRPILRETRAYLHKCILSPYVQEMVWGRQVGMAREGLSKKVLELFEIPLPPLEEQRRIVAKVDELMALCDELEAQLVTSAATRHQLLEATLHEALSSSLEPGHSERRAS